PYYALPSAANARAWAARTPADFAFGVKAYAALTQHPLEPARLDQDLQRALPRELRRKRNVYANQLPEAVRDELWRRFHAALEPLRAAGKLVYVLFQMPKWFTPSRASEAYLEQVPARLPGAPIAGEFRQPRWMGDARRARTLDRLRSARFVHVPVDETQRPHPRAPAAPSPPPPACPKTNLGRVRSTSTGMSESAARHDTAIAIGMRVPKSRMPRNLENPITENPAPMLAATKRTARPEVCSAAPNAA